MGFIREKKVKGQTYLYFCQRKRSRIKDGGTGRVISVERLLGKSIFRMEYLPYWLWAGLSVEEFAESYARFRLKKYEYDKKINFSIQWKMKRGKPIKGKIIFRSIPGSEGDARKKYPRYLRRAIQDVINQAIALQDSRQNEIERTAYFLAKGEESKRRLKNEESDYRLWAKNPHREWIEDGVTCYYSSDYGDNSLEIIELYRKNSDSWFRMYQEMLDAIVNSSPPSEQETFKKQIIQQVEKLATRENYIDWFEGLNPEMWQRLIPFITN